EVLGMMRKMARDGLVSVAMITHRFREVMEFCDEVTVLRKGRLAGSGKTADHTPESLAELMVGAEPPRASLERTPVAADTARLEIVDLTADDDLGLPVLEGVTLSVRPGEIVGVAGVSGNGQDELVEILAGQRSATGGVVRVA